MTATWKERALATRNEHVAAGMTEAPKADAVTRTAGSRREAAVTRRMKEIIAAGRVGNGFMGRGTYDTTGRTAGYERSR